MLWAFGRLALAVKLARRPGVLAEDLRMACLAALQLDRGRCAELAARQSWRASALEFLAQQPLLDGERCQSTPLSAT